MKEEVPLLTEISFTKCEVKAQQPQTYLTITRDF